MSLERLKLFVFDLDYTLWPFWVDAQVSPPFRKTSTDQIVDSQEKQINCYPEVPEIIKNLYEEGYLLGVASRTTEISGALQLIELFGWNKYFSYIEIYPERKTRHLENIQNKSGINFDQMIFFDDEYRNIRDINQVGVFCKFVKDGLHKAVIEDAKRQFVEQHK